LHLSLAESLRSSKPASISNRIDRHTRHSEHGMKKEQLAKRLAKESHITPAAAADQVDRILNDILKRVRKGQSASLPGLGTFAAGPTEKFKFDTAPQIPKGPKKESR
jgi:Bacterial DNA-binding protein